MQTLIVFAVVIAIIVLPVMFAARLVGAQRNGFWWALLAVILQSAVSTFTSSLATTQWVSMLIAVVVGSAVYALVLSTTMIRGFAISVLAVLIAALSILVLGSSLAILGVNT